MANPDLQIRGVGVGAGLKKFFGPSGLSLVKNSGGGGGGPGRAPRALPLDPPLEWSSNHVSSTCSLSLLLCSKPLTQLVTWHERKEKGECEHENRNKKQTKKQNQKHGKDCAFSFGSGKS